MLCLVINLDSARERLGFMAQQLDDFGLAWERLAALTAPEASAERPTCYWNRWERPLKDTEKACFLSHVSAWERVARDGVPMLILEDDALLSRRVPPLLAAVETRTGVDHLSLEVRGRKKLVGNLAEPLADGLATRPLYQDRSGAAAYILWPEGAKKLLSRARRAPGIADAVICAAYEIRSYQTEPACAVQLDQCGELGLTPPIETRSSIAAGRPAPAGRSTGHRLRRAAAQLRMGLRALAHFHHARPRKIPFEPADFSQALGPGVSSR